MRTFENLMKAKSRSWGMMRSSAVDPPRQYSLAEYIPFQSKVFCKLQ